MEREELLSQARAIIDGAALPDVDKAMWREVIDRLSDDALELFSDIMSDPTLLGATNDSFKAKYMAKDDPDLLREVIQKENEDIVNTDSAK